ncbi:MAG: hypothetical protein ACLTK0_05740 [Anaerovoracaceae bacterium]
MDALLARVLIGFYSGGDCLIEFVVFCLLLVGESLSAASAVAMREHALYLEVIQNRYF